MKETQKKPLATVRPGSQIESYWIAERRFAGGLFSPVPHLTMTELIWKLRLQRVRFIPLLETAVERQVLRCYVARGPSISSGTQHSRTYSRLLLRSRNESTNRRRIWFTQVRMARRPSNK